MKILRIIQITLDLITSLFTVVKNFIVTNKEVQNESEDINKNEDGTI